MDRYFLTRATLPALLLGACAGLLAFSALASGPMPRDTPSWTYLGPEVATVTRLAVSPLDPDTLMVTLDTGREYARNGLVFRTDDAGLHWREVGRFTNDATDVLIDAQGRLLVSEHTAVHESLDDGITWTPRRAGIPVASPLFSQIALRGDGSGALWGRMSNWNAQTIYRISQPGLSPWHDVTPALHAGMQLQGMALSDSQPGTVAVAGVNATAGLARVWVSTDNGNSWSERGQALPASRVADMRFQGGRLLLAMAQGEGDAATGLFASDDLGLTWDHLWGGSGPASAVNQIAFDASGTSLWLATESQGLHRSDDGGMSWALSVGGTGGLRTSAVAFDDASGRVWLGVHREGVWLSVDGGDSFSPRAHFLNPVPTVRVASNPLDFGELAVGQYGTFSGAHVMTSTDGGAAWTAQSHPGAYFVWRVRFDPHGRLFATLSEQFTHTLMRREPSEEWVDIGLEWNEDEFRTITDMHFGAAEDTLVMGGRLRLRGSAENYPTLWRSSDGGQHWSLVHQGDVGSSSFEQMQRLQTPDAVMLVTLQKQGVFGANLPGRLVASTDDGQTWTSLSDTLPPFLRGAVCSDGVEMISLLASFGNRLRLWRSFDAGSSWVSTDWDPGEEWAAGGPFNALHCGEDHDVLLTGGRLGRVLQSTDGGNSFRALDAGLEALDQPVNSFHATPAGLYMGTGRGVWFHPAPDMLPIVPEGLAVVRQGGRMRSTFDLHWAGGAEQVDIRRDGAVVATMPNTGHYRTTLMAFQHTAEPAWQVCNAGSSECTAVVTSGPARVAD